MAILDRDGDETKTETGNIGESAMPKREQDHFKAPSHRRTSADSGGIRYGRHAVTAALARLRTGKDLEGMRLYLLSGEGPPWRRGIEEEARRVGLSPLFCSRSELDRLAGDRHHQGCLLILGKQDGPQTRDRDPVRFVDLFPTTPTEPSVVLVLDGIEDPRNFGACLRAAAGFGCRGVIVPERRMSPLTPAARKAAAGYEHELRIITVPNVAASLERLKGGGYWLVGLDPHVPDALDACDLRGPRAFVMGGEGRGLRSLVRARCDFLVGIRLVSGVDSLNVAVATGITLYEYRRQNGWFSDDMPRPEQVTS